MIPGRGQSVGAVYNSAQVEFKFRVTGTRHGKNLFIISISGHGCGHGTAAVGPDRAGPNCDGSSLPVPGP
jgi:hypothetical protein